MRILLLCVLLTACTHAPSTRVLQKPSTESGVGFSFLETRDPLKEKRLKALVFDRELGGPTGP